MIFRDEWQRRRDERSSKSYKPRPVVSTELQWFHKHSFKSSKVPTRGKTMDIV